MKHIHKYKLGDIVKVFNSWLIVIADDHIGYKIHWLWDKEQIRDEYVSWYWLDNINN